MTGALITLFLCGDVMTGRGIDQALPHSAEPALHEPYIKDARRYVELAERESGQIGTPLDFDAIWGEALGVLDRLEPDARIINLETSVTTSDEPWPGKGIHYRMDPRNAPVLTIAEIDCCALANNHALDWERAGLVETLESLEGAGIKTAGAGRSESSASEPAVLEVGDGRRALVFSYCTRDSGVPNAWAAGADRWGVNLLPALDEAALQRVGDDIEAHARGDDLVVASIHWGGNWGYDLPAEQIEFAHRLVDDHGVDIVHGHSSHHAKALEVYRGRLVLYGCGDLISDYEGIGGHERFRSELSLMYFPSLDAHGRLAELVLVPTRMRRFRLEVAEGEDRDWLLLTLRRECERFGVGFTERADGAFVADWGRTEGEERESE